MVQEITIRVNDKDLKLESGSTIQRLLDILEIKNRAIAVELNLQIAASDNFASTTLQDGDEVEIVTLVGGG